MKGDVPVDGFWSIIVYNAKEVFLGVAAKRHRCCIRAASTWNSVPVL